MGNAMDGDAGGLSGDTEEAEMFDAAVSGESVSDSPDSQADQTPGPTSSGPARDPATGRFAAKDGEIPEPMSDVETAIPEGDAATDDGVVDTGEEAGKAETDAARSQGQVPSWRLAEETTRRREAEAAAVQLAETVNALQAHMQQMAASPPDVEADAADPGDPETTSNEVGPEQPDVMSNMQAEVQGGIRAMRLENALGRAQDRHGNDAFHEAYMAFANAAAAGDAASYMRVMNAPDPGEAVMQWHSEQRLLHETGGDPSAYRQRVAGELKADPAFRQEVLDALRAEALGAEALGAENQGRGNQGQAPNTITQVPPSLSTLPGGGGSPHTGRAEGAYDEEALFKEALGRRA